MMMINNICGSLSFNLRGEREAETENALCDENCGETLSCKYGVRLIYKHKQKHRVGRQICQFCGFL